MQFGLTETQQTLKNTVRKFLAAECPMAEVRRLMETETATDSALWKKIADQGWNGIIFPEEYGGFGMGMVEMAVTLEEMGRALLPGPFFSTVLLAGTVIESAGTEAQKRKYLGAICRGEAKATLAILEADTSWSPALLKMKASANVLNGTKLFVTDAAAADLLVVVAWQDSELALFVVPANAKGISIQPLPSMDHTRKLYEVSFSNVAAELLAQGPAAQTALDRALNIATVGLTSEMTGGMQRLLETTVEYAKTRKQFGRPIGQFQAVQHQCADMLVYCESSRSASYFAAYSVQEGTPDAALAVSVAKTYASDAYRESGNRAIQVHGGMGFTWENDCHLFYRRAKASELMLGDAAFHRERVAKTVVDHANASKPEAVAVA